MADDSIPAVRFLGVDTGGTFTDLVQLGGPGGLRMEKSFSTPSHPERAVRAVLDDLAAAEQVPLADLLAATVRFGHGTTVSTNALIQRKGALLGELVGYPGQPEPLAEGWAQPRAGNPTYRRAIGHHGVAVLRHYSVQHYEPDQPVPWAALFGAQ